MIASLPPQTDVFVLEYSPQRRREHRELNVLRASLR